MDKVNFCISFKFAAKIEKIAGEISAGTQTQTSSRRETLLRNRAFVGVLLDNQPESNLLFLMPMTQKEIFGEIAFSIMEVLPRNENFKEAVLEIVRHEGSVKLTGYYISENSEKKWLDIFNINLSDAPVHELYTITQTQSPVHANWNRAKFILYPDNQVNMTYIWDQALQDEVDKYNKFG